MLKSNKLSAELQAVKRKLNFSLITFEDANIELDPFVRVHPFETINFMTQRRRQALPGRASLTGKWRESKQQMRLCSDLVALLDCCLPGF